MARADFSVITFNEHLGDTESDLSASWATFVGNATTVKNFDVDGVPTGLGYVLVQAFDVQSSGHRIKINGQDLNGGDLPPHPAGSKWQTWMDGIQSGILKSGNNTIQIVRESGEDNFLIANVTINWRVQS